MNLKPLIAILVQLISAVCFSQYNLSCYSLKKLSFPVKFDSVVTKQVKYYYTNTESLSLACITLVNPENDIDESKKNRLLQNYTDGFFSSENWKYFKREQVDTTIAGVKGKLVHGFDPTKPMKIKEFYNFFTIVKLRYYTLMGGTTGELTTEIRKQIDSFLNSAEFK